MDHIGTRPVEHGGVLQVQAPPPAIDTSTALPPTTAGLRRLFKHPHLMHYNRLIVAALAVNLAVLCFCLTAGGWWSGHSIALRDIAVAAQANLAVAIIVRQQYVINALCSLATRAPTRWPLKLRWMLAKCYYHVGGLHVGSAVSGAMWYAVFAFSSFTVADTQHIPVQNLALAALLAILLAVMIVMAAPPIRARHHDHFEVTHRFCGWSVLVIGWANTVLFVDSQRGRPSLVVALSAAPTVWILVVTSVSAALTWGRLRRVPIVVDKPSPHVAIVTLDHKGPKPIIGSVRQISHNPLAGWHSFANVPAAPSRPGGYRMVVSRAGDWTSRFIDNPPSHMWIRGIPTAGMANVRRLFKKVVYVATGSGIGPMLAHLMVNEVPGHLVWVTRNPRKTYGDALVEEILTAQPEATIWDTDLHGRPDPVRLAYSAYLATGAEAVICVANKKVTWQVVHGLEQLGIPACGPIWDS